MRVIIILTGLIFIIACNNNRNRKKEERKKPVIVNTDTLFRGLGTEPFWIVLVINNGTFVFHPAEGSDIVMPYGITANTDTYTEFNGSDEHNKFFMRVKKEKCSDGMSDREYPRSVDLKLNGTGYHGCGYMGAEYPKESEDR